MRVLNVAEKNDAAKSIATIMSNGQMQRRDGRSKYNKIYEFECNLLGQHCHMTMTSVSGHLLNYDFTQQHKKWHSCHPSALFDAPVVKFCPQDYQPIKETLTQLARTAQRLVIWTDCDREGENIGMEIVTVCLASNPRLDVHRARFSEITRPAVQRALATLTRVDERVSEAVDARQELDLRIGAAFTRFQTLRLKQVFPGMLAEQLVSYGSCQFPTLGFVVERFKEAERFQSEPFWRLRVMAESPATGQGAEFLWKRGRVYDQAVGQMFLAHVLESPAATVTNVESRPKSRWRPCALDTVEFEKLSSKKLRINAKEAMKIAERLYTQGYISYPRTETNIFPKDFNLRGLVQTQAADGRWAEFAQRVLTEGPNPRNGRKSDQAHPPIHPLKCGDRLANNEARVFELIARHFLACCSKDAVGQETKVTIDINSEGFEAKGLMIIERNYLEVYVYDKWCDRELPLFQQGQQFQPSDITLVEGQTSAPSLLTEADLIGLMDKHGIGTDATHADHIETVKQRLYVGLQDTKFLVPGQLGIGLVEGYDAMGFHMSKPDLRASLEADLKAICEGRRTKQEVLQCHIERYRRVFDEACRQANLLDERVGHYLEEQPATVAPQLPDSDAGAANNLVRHCPQCGTAEMALKTKRDGAGYYIGCLAYPTCRRAVWLPDSVQRASVAADTLCPACSTRGPVRKLTLHFSRAAPPPFCDSLDGAGHTVCVFCDPNYTNVFGGAASTVGGGGGSQPRPGGAAISFHGNDLQPPAAAARSMQQRLFLQPEERQSLMAAPPPLNPPASAAATCACNLPARVFTVQKEGPNKGKQFYKCASGTCTHWKWADADAGGGNASFVASTPASSQFGGGGGGGADAGNSVACKCGTPAQERTVQKEGPNKGRAFLSCPKPRNESCGFFQWADEPGGSGGGGGGRFGGGNGNVGGYQGGGGGGGRLGGGSDDVNGYQGGGGRFGGGSDDVGGYQGGGGGADACNSVACRCGTPARERTVQKEGPNKGRAFFGCPKPMSESCGFFQWADEPGGGGGGGDSFGGYQGGGGFNNRGGGGFQPRAAAARRGPAGGGGAEGRDPGGPKKQRKCGACGQPGHTRNKCAMLIN